MILLIFTGCLFTGCLGVLAVLLALVYPRPAMGVQHMPWQRIRPMHSGPVRATVHAPGFYTTSTLELPTNYVPGKLAAHYRHKRKSNVTRLKIRLVRA